MRGVRVMQAYFIDGFEVSAHDPDFERIIAEAYVRRERPRCLCNRHERLYLYIAKRSEKYVLARWPGSGNNHAPDCDHYEAPDFLNGLGQLRGNAIVDDNDTGETFLKFGFPLSKAAARAAPSAITNDKPVVKATVQRLTMRGVLHYLWDRAQLTHWAPKMENKRNWYVVRRELMSALVNCKVRGEPLAKVVYVPETFYKDKKEEISGRRRENLGLARASREAIMVVVGEIKDFRKSALGEQVFVKHLPDWPFLLDEQMAKRFHERFKTEEALHAGSVGRTKLVMAASFAIGRAGYAEIFEISVIVVSNQWLPVESMDELDLVDKAVAESRRFAKGLRFNLDVDRRVASLVLTDTGSQPTAVYLEDAMPSSDNDHALTELLDGSGIRYVMWRPGSRLPAKQFRQAPPPRSGSEDRSIAAGDTRHAFDANDEAVAAAGGHVVIQTDADQVHQSAVIALPYQQSEAVRSPVPAPPLALLGSTPGSTLQLGYSTDNDPGDTPA